MLSPVRPALSGGVAGQGWKVDAFRDAVASNAPRADAQLEDRFVLTKVELVRLTPVAEHFQQPHD